MGVLERVATPKRVRLLILFRQAGSEEARSQKEFKPGKQANKLQPNTTPNACCACCRALRRCASREPEEIKVGARTCAREDLLCVLESRRPPLLRLLRQQPHQLVLHSAPGIGSSCSAAGVRSGDAGAAGGQEHPARGGVCQLLPRLLILRGCIPLPRQGVRQKLQGSGGGKALSPCAAHWNHHDSTSACGAAAARQQAQGKAPRLWQRGCGLACSRPTGTPIEAPSAAPSTVLLSRLAPFTAGARSARGISQGQAHCAAGVREGVHTAQLAAAAGTLMRSARGVHQLCAQPSILST